MLEQRQRVLLMINHFQVLSFDLAEHGVRAFFMVDSHLTNLANKVAVKVLKRSLSFSMLTHETRGVRGFLVKPWSLFFLFVKRNKKKQKSVIRYSDRIRDP